MTLNDMFEAMTTWQDALERMKRAAHMGSAKELRDAVNDCDYVRHHITESFGMTPAELEQQITAWRAV